MTTKQAAAIQSFMTTILAGLALVLTLTAMIHTDNAERQARADKITAQDNADAAKIKVEQKRAYQARIVKIIKKNDLHNCTVKSYLTDKIVVWNEISDKMWISTFADYQRSPKGTWVLRYCS